VKPNFGEVLAKTGFDTEEAMRKLYALSVMGWVDFAESVGEAPPPEPAPATPSAPAATQAIPEADDALKNALMATYLESRTKDPFDLLGVKEDIQPLPLRKAFLALADKFSPLRFESQDLREKAEALLVSFAKAYGALADVDQLSLWRKRRANAAEKKSTSARPSTAEQFRISTDLLDARSQYVEGKKRLDANNPKGAFEYFQYACDIEPKPTYRAYLAWARYLMNPKSHARLALAELGEVAKTDPTCEDAAFFSAEIHRAENHFDLAEEQYRAAFKANPQNRKYADLANEMTKLKKTGKR
jgi:tetratricopeptide (TPR) repeat protein